MRVGTGQGDVQYVCDMRQDCGMVCVHGACGSWGMYIVSGCLCEYSMCDVCMVCVCDLCIGICEY